MIVNKRDESCLIIDVAIPEDGRVRKKEDTKVEKYQDLADSGGNGGIRISTKNEFEKQLEGY